MPKNLTKIYALHLYTSICSKIRNSVTVALWFYSYAVDSMVEVGINVVYTSEYLQQQGTKLYIIFFPTLL